MFWQPENCQPPIRVQGELYTSPVFINAHRELQDSPGEPGCDLPRVIVAMMFWSDGTHLTSFGNAKLWPLYLYFGNDSKYRRCKPSCNLCDHVAYFQSASCCSFPTEYHSFIFFNSSPTLLKTLPQRRQQEEKPQVQHSSLTVLTSFSMPNGKYSWTMIFCKLGSMAS